MPGKIVVANPAAPDPQLIEEAARRALEGGLLLYPTDTLYGLGTDARNSTAVARVYATKGRPAHRPLPVIIGNLEQLELLTPPLASEVMSLLEQLWPAPLTVVLPARSDLPVHLLSHGSSIAVRWPKAPLAAALCTKAATPLTATSANRSGCGESTSFAEALRQVGHAVDLALDAGPPPDLRGSTIIDLCSEPRRLLRRGAVPVAKLQRLLGNLADASASHA